MNSIASALAPVVLLILVGFFAGRRRWVDPQGSAQISRLCFSMLSPALLFRTMSNIQVQASDLLPVVAYFIAVLTLFAGTALALGRDTRSIVMALSATYGNLVMIGIPLITLAFGQQGLVYLFALLSVHSLILLTLGTIALEWARAREHSSRGSGDDAPARMPVIGRALRNALINPVVLPIACGLIWSQTGWTIPTLIDRPLQWMGQAFSPLALLLVGISLAQLQGGTSAQAPRRVTIAITGAKNLLQPILVGCVCALMGIHGMAALVIVVAAALPTGATVFMFAQRYGVARDQVANTVALSTLIALAGLPLAMYAASRLL